MPDFGSPVAQNTNPVGQGLSALMNIQNYQRGQQALQTGQYQQQSAQATAQQDQQKNQELQALSQFTKSASQNPAYHNPDGSLNVQKFQTDAMAVAPVYGQESIGQVTRSANALIENRKAMLNLSNEQRTSMGNYFGAVAAKPNATGEDLMTAVENARSLSDDPSYQRSLDRVLVSTPNTHGMTDAQGSAAIQNFARNVAVQTGAPNAALSERTKDTMQAPGGLQGVNLNPMAPGGVGPQGPVMKQGVAPGVIDLGNGQKAVLGSNGSYQLLSAGRPSSANTSTSSASKLPAMVRPGANAPAADQTNYNARIKALGDEYGAVSTATNDPMNGVQSTRFRNQQILDLIPHASTGPGMRMLNTVASRLPGSTGDAYQDLEHYLSQNSASLAQTMGVPKTNLGAETAAAAAGNVERNPGALREITRTNDALNTAMDLYNRGFAKVTNNGSDMSRAASYKQAFGQNLDINAVRWADAHRRSDQQELEDLQRKLGPKGLQQAQQRLQVLRSLAANGDLP